MMMKGIYAANGVALSKSAARAGDELDLIYNGLLKNCGASEVKAHIGYNEGWEDAITLDMVPINDVFMVRLALKKAGTLNCAFVDPLGNWDNNSGANYSFKVAKPKAISKEKPDAVKYIKEEAILTGKVAEVSKTTRAEVTKINKKEKAKKEPKAKKTSKAMAGVNNTAEKPIS